MTPTQSTQLSRIAGKHAEQGWYIEQRSITMPKAAWMRNESPTWECHLMLYRAVGPRKRVELKRGMEVLTSDYEWLVLGVSDAELFLSRTTHKSFSEEDWVRPEAVLRYRWPNGDGTWLPIEGEPEIISMEGVE